MRAIYLLSVWLHIIAAAVWIGGMVFLALVLIPIIRRPEFRGQASSLVHFTGIRFRWIGWASIFLLLLTGATNLVFRGISVAVLSSGDFWRSPFGWTLGSKLIVVAVVLALSIVHDFFIGPKASAAGRANPASPEAMRLRRQASWFGRVNLVLALIIALFGIMLVRGTF
ncbi:MAG: DUF4149 domain-containing protein [Deltaproteobacteria bacterium]|nr:DUF4149 domain-containing protein [Deltaproteobacteria bacterium]